MRQTNLWKSNIFSEILCFSSLRVFFQTDSSPGGLYIRQVRLLFNEMSIGNLERFNTKLLDYLESGCELLDDSGSFVAPKKTLPQSVPDSFSVFTVQQETNLILNNPSLVGYSSREGCGNLLNLSTKPTVDNVQFVMFLDCIRRKDFGQAVSALHKFFDLKTVHEEVIREQGAGFACLHLCIMHYNCGNPALALRFLQVL